MTLTAGLDEVGWGAGAGPLVSVVVIATEKDLMLMPKGVTDSKKLSEAKRVAYFELLCATVTDIGIGMMEPDEIDRMSPKWALQESYNRALAELRFTPDILIVDGTEWMNKVRKWTGPQHCEPKADFNYKQVSIASVIAKVIRDEIMVARARKLTALGYPDYNWAKNKGYFTPDHLEAIKKHGLLFGPDPVGYQHRRSYCKDLMGKVKIYGCA